MSSKFFKKNKSYPGFSLLELMVVIAIMGILLTISTISFDATRKAAIVEAATSEVFSALKMTKGYALQGKMPDATNPACGHSSICGYGLRFLSSSQYEVFYYYKCNGSGKLDCSGDPSTAAFTKETVDKQNLKNGATLISPTSPTDANSGAFFGIPWGDMKAVSAKTYVVGFTGRTKQATVSINGLIQRN